MECWNKEKSEDWVLAKRGVLDSLDPLLQYSSTPAFIFTGTNPMPKEDRPQKPLYYEILGLVLGAVGILILLALFSHHPADPSFSSPQMGDLPIKNWVGKIGSYSSSFLFECAGPGLFLARFHLSSTGRLFFPQRLPFPHLPGMPPAIF